MDRGAGYEAGVSLTEVLEEEVRLDVGVEFIEAKKGAGKEVHGRELGRAPKQASATEC